MARCGLMADRTPRLDLVEALMAHLGANRDQVLEGTITVGATPDRYIVRWSCRAEVDRATYDAICEQVGAKRVAQRPPQHGGWE